MFVACVVVSVLLALAVTGSAAGKLTKNPKVVESLTNAGVPQSWLPRLASAELAGAVGLLVGLVVAPIGVAAAIGLIAYFVGAVIAHLKVKDKMIAPPLVLGLIAVAALVLRLATV